MAARNSRRMREAVWALLLATLLSAGVLSILLLNTAMQQQAVRVTHQQEQVAKLAVESQAVQTALERESDPTLLARRAKALHMRPAEHIKWATTTHR